MIIIMIIVIIVIIIYFFVYFKFYSAVSGFDQVFHFKILSNFFSVIFLIQGAAPFFPRCRDDAFAYEWLRKHVSSHKCGIFCEG